MKNTWWIKRWKSPTLFLWIFSIMWFGFYWFFMFPMHLLMFTWTQVSWIVTDVKVHEDDEDGDTYEPRVKYTCGWIATEQRQWFSSSSHYREWENVKVFCDENNPNKFVIKSFSNYIMLIFPFLWLFALYFAIKNLFEDIKRSRLKNKLSHYWVHIEAIISEIKDTWAMMGDTPWYNIIATCDWKQFMSETVYAKLKYILKEWDKIDVYLDPINSNDYWMDTDSIFDKPIRNDYGVDNNIDNLNTDQNIVQNPIINNTESVTTTSWNIVTHNTEEILPRPPKISEKKCPIRRVKNGYWLGIIFSLIWWWSMVLFLLSIINTMKDEWWNSISISDILPGIFFWGIFLSVWLIMLIPQIKSNKKKKRLMEWWVKKEGMITEIYRNNTTINDQRWYIITAIYDWKLYKSVAVYADIYYLVEKGDEIDIYVGTWWDEDYRVDVDSIFYREPKPSYYDKPKYRNVFSIIKEMIKNKKN